MSHSIIFSPLMKQQKFKFVDRNLGVNLLKLSIWKLVSCIAEAKLYPVKGIDTTETSEVLYGLSCWSCNHIFFLRKHIQRVIQRVHILCQRAEKIYADQDSFPKEAYRQSVIQWFIFDARAEKIYADQDSLSCFVICWKACLWIFISYILPMLVFENS